MNDGTSEPRCCSVCSGPLRSNNTIGICTAAPGCRTAAKRAYLERKRLAAAGGHSQPEPGPCKTCGAPLRRDNKTGVCSTNPDCSSAYTAANRQKQGTKPQRSTAIEAGEVFGCWTALEGHRNRTGRHVLCRCACGKEKPVTAFQLVAGISRSCGCAVGRSAIAAERLARAMANPYLRAGERVNLLVALEDAPLAKTVITCRCDCGVERRVQAGYLRRHMTSCGHTTSATLSALKTVHGLSKHPLFSTWMNMMSRCYNPNVNSYPNYGGRGIRVYEPWRTDPAAFVAWATENLGGRPEGWSINRIDNDSGYFPGNVEWAPPKEQAANRRTVQDVTRERDALAARVTELEHLLVRESARPLPNR